MYVDIYVYVFIITYIHIYTYICMYINIQVARVVKIIHFMLRILAGDAYERHLEGF